VAGRKEDEVNQGAILRAFFALGIFYFQEKEKMKQLKQSAKRKIAIIGK